jgi:hypothetical protein
MSDINPQRQYGLGLNYFLIEGANTSFSLCSCGSQSGGCQSAAFTCQRRPGSFASVPRTRPHPNLASGSCSLLVTAPDCFSQNTTGPSLGCGADRVLGGKAKCCPVVWDVRRVSVGFAWAIDDDGPLTQRTEQLVWVFRREHMSASGQQRYLPGGGLVAECRIYLNRTSMDFALTGLTPGSLMIEEERAAM